MKQFNLLFGSTLSLLSAISCAEEPKQPNILYIMSDDHTTQGIGAYGSRLATLNPTPNIDRLAKEGIRMDRTFCTNAISTPSRGGGFDGQHHHHLHRRPRFHVGRARLYRQTMDV